MKKKACSLLILLYSLFTFTCSSAPQPSVVEVNTSRYAALSQLEHANRAANRGRFQEALFLLDEGRRLAISADDPSLRIRTSISRGDILFSLGHMDEAFSEWDSAAAEGDASNLPVLAALARIHTIRFSVLLIADGHTVGAGVNELRVELERLLPPVRQDPMANAGWYITMSLAERQLERWSEAETAARRALDIFDRNLSLEDSAYACFLIASIRSLAGNYNAALDALRTSISIDRRVENSYGLARSWQATGDVYQKAGRVEDARMSWNRAAQIYRAIGFDDHAILLESR